MAMLMEQRDGVIWLDGRFIPWQDARVHVLTHTLHYGMGVFEGIRAYLTEQGTAIFRLQDHTQRLFNSATVVRMRIPFSMDDLNEVQKEVVRKNGLQSAYIRPLVFYGAESMGLHADQLDVHVMVAAWEWGAYLGEETMRNGVQVKTSSFIRCHSNPVMSKVKSTGSYLNSMLALREACDAGCKEALMLDADGYVCEGSGENLFIVRNGTLFTPDLSAALDGITRRSVMTLAREQGLEVNEQRLNREDIYVADEAFFTGTAAEVTPIRVLDERTIGTGRRGPVTERLQSLYFDVVHGKSTAHGGWLDPV